MAEVILKWQAEGEGKINGLKSRILFNSLTPDLSLGLQTVQWIRALAMIVKKVIEKSFITNDNIFN